MIFAYNSMILSLYFVYIYVKLKVENKWRYENEKLC